MSGESSIVENMIAVYVSEAGERFLGRGFGTSEPVQGVRESVGSAELDTRVFRQLMIRLVDEALDRISKNPTGMSEPLANLADQELARGLGRPLEEVRAFILAETPRLVNLNRLTGLLNQLGGARIPEAACLSDDREQTIVAAEEGSLRALMDQVAEVAKSPYSVLITGESGTGKELVAGRLHQLSRVSTGPFVAIDCAALTESLVESELFGHEKGAFTGAIRAKPGKIELAAGGTLFLDEIGELPISSQVKLLRFLQERTLTRVGGIRPIKVKVRVVAATSRNLETALAEGRFREDLYYRLAVIPIEVPPLRERPEDIPKLLDHYLTRANLETDKVRRFSAVVRNLLISYEYPGNVRELINMVSHLVAVSKKHFIAFEDLPESLARKLARPGQDPSYWLIVLEEAGIKTGYRDSLAELLTERSGRYIVNADLRQALGCVGKTATKILNQLARSGLVLASGENKARRYKVVGRMAETDNDPQRD